MGEILTRANGAPSFGVMARRPLWALALVPARLFGQNAASDVHSPAATYLERYQEISNLAPLPGRVAEVNHLVLSRDVGRLILERGTLYLLTPVGGRTVAALFRGEGRFGFAPDTPAERAELQRFAGSPVLEDTLTEAILIFSDSTAEQLGALAFRRAEIPGEVGDHVHDLIGTLKGRNDGAFSSDVIGPLLSGEPSGFFLARVERAQGGAVLFQINPEESGAVRLYRPVSRLRWGSSWACRAIAWMFSSPQRRVRTSISPRAPRSR